LVGRKVLEQKEHVAAVGCDCALIRRARRGSRLSAERLYCPEQARLAAVQDVPVRCIRDAKRLSQQDEEPFLEIGCLNHQNSPFTAADTALRRRCCRRNRPAPYGRASVESPCFRRCGTSSGRSPAAEGCRSSSSSRRKGWCMSPANARS